MEGFKEFEGKSLDAAIQDACDYYNAVREKLEIEILQDAKSGIFGLVGARKARIRARRAALREALASALGRGGRRAEGAETRTEDPAEARPAERTETPAKERLKGRAEERNPSLAGRNRPRRPEGETEEIRSQRAPRKAAPPVAGKAPASPLTPPGIPPGVPPTREAVAPDTAPLPVMPATEDPAATEPLSASGGCPAAVDSERLEALAVEAVGRLVRPIAGDGVTLCAEALDGRVRVAIEGADDSGLLIGREGQTLAALQYLASRIVARAVNAAVRVQLDAGSYRLRQDEKLREIALALADRVRQTGRSFSTRPLSSYHRRIVHLALQDAPDVQTRSTGEGPLKRVTVFRRRSGGQDAGQGAGRERN